MTKNAIWFIAAAVGIALAFLVKSPYVAFSVYAFFLLVTVAHFSSVLWLSGLDCVRTLDKTVLQQGEEVEVRTRITNRRGWPIPWIFVEDWVPPDFPIQGSNRRLAVLMPGRSIELRYTVTCPRRGYHRIGPLLMESGDVFGLQKRFRTGEQQDYISVLPTVAYIETFNISTRRPQGPVRISNRIYVDPTRIANIREYSPGDPLNAIHWKLSARSGELFVKTHEPSTVLGGTLLLDLHEAGYAGDRVEERMELAITTTASIAYLLQVSGEQVGLLTNARDAAEVARFDIEAQQALSREDAYRQVVGEEISDRIRPLAVPTRRTSGQARQIIENLSRVIPTDGLSLDSVLLSEFQRLPRDAALLPVVPQVTPELALLLGEMKLNGFSVSVFIIDNFQGYREAQSLLAPHRIGTFHIEHERNLHEISPARIGH
jgi:uncharacterized protein (DUF58 family)